MQTCKVCNIAKELVDFRFRNKKKRIRHNQCRACDAEYKKRNYTENKLKIIPRTKQNVIQSRLRKQEFIFEYLRNKYCIDCGETDPIVFDFDHVRGKKEFCISIGTMSRSLTKLKEELSKCEIRCSNCHRRKTAKERNYWIYQKINGSMTERKGV